MDFMEVPAVVSSSTSMEPLVRELDPLLKDLSEKKQSFRQSVVSLAAELKEMRCRLASQEQCFAKESVIRQEAESKVISMQIEIDRLQKSLEEKNVHLQASTSAADTYAQELDLLRLQLSEAKATADASALSAQSAQSQCVALVSELEEKECSLKEHKSHEDHLEEQLNHLQKDLRAKEFSQMLLKDKVSRVEHEILQALGTGANKDFELQKIIDKVSPKNCEKIDKLLSLKDGEISELRDEIRVMSAQWKLKTTELESQLEKHHRAHQELKKKALKLEFCVQETRAQTRKLQRMGERRDKAFEDLRDQLAAKQHQPPPNHEKKNIWETSGFKIVVSVSMVVIVMFSKG